MKIYDLKTIQEKDDIKLCVSIESQRLGVKELWFSTPKRYEEYLCKTRMDGFVVGMLFPAMQYGEDIHVFGCVSEKLLFNLNNYAVSLILAFSPSCKKIKITADETSAERFQCHGVGTGFSGGVDSFCTVYDRFERESLPGYKINSLLFLNVGSHTRNGQVEDIVFAKQKFQARYDYLKNFSDEVGLDFIPLDSNLHTFHPWGHLKTVTLTTVSGVLVLQSYFNRYYIASVGFSYKEQIEMWPKLKDISVAEFCDPIIMPLLSTESLDLVLDGIQYSRVEKTLRIINYEPVRRYLNVCVSGGEGGWKNCSICPKCCRTLMVLNSAGKMEQFRNIFDIERYKKEAEQRYICEQMIHRNESPFANENIAFAKSHGVKLPYLLFCIVSIKLFLSRIKWFAIKNISKILKATLPSSAIMRIKRCFAGFLKG